MNDDDGYRQSATGMEIDRGASLQGGDPGAGAQGGFGEGAHSLRDRLKRISLRLTAECVIGALCLIPLVSDHVLLVVLVSAFFVVMGVMHAVQYRMLSRLDLSAATVIEALGMVCRLELFRRTRRMIGLTLMVPLMVYMVMSFADSYDVYMLPCCLLGLVAGCVVGIAVNRRTTKLLREMKSQLACES